MPYTDRQKQLAYQNEWMQKRRMDWILDHGPCTKCSSWEDPEVDHIEKGKKVSHRVWSWAEERRNEELKKCQVLCGKCHKEKTAEEFKAEAKHGTYTMRNQYECACEECMEFVRRSKREWRERVGHN